MCKLSIFVFFLGGCAGLSVESKLIEQDGKQSNSNDTGQGSATMEELQISQVILSPDPAFTNDLLEAEVSVSHANASLDYEWHVVNVVGDGMDNIVQSGSVSLLDGAIHFERGQMVYVAVTAEVDGVSSETVLSQEVPISNTPPSAPALSISPTPGIAGFDDIRCAIETPSMDVDGDTVKYAYEWYGPNGALVFGEPPSPKTESFLDADLTAEGVWKCKVIPSDRVDVGDPSEIGVILEPPSLAYPFTAHSFTTCNQTGWDGPSLSQCQAQYSTEVWASDLQFFDVDNGIQQWLVPASGSYEIIVSGAQGGPNHCGDSGGLGAEMKGDFVLSYGDWLNIIVGQSGVISSSGNCANGGGGGGGGSFVWVDGESTPLIVAGGGGGSGLTNNGYPNCIGMDAPITPDGTAARDGSPGGSNGADGNNGGGTGWNSIQLKPDGTDGSANTYNGTGGFGGGGRGGNPMDCGNNQHSPGAGGGYSGGGATVTCYHAGGAGGSFNAGNNTDDVPGLNSGDGLVIIRYLGPS
ncbi:MAG: glycine-rich protein [Myxococcota bacterium]